MSENSNTQSTTTEPVGSANNSEKKNSRRSRPSRLKSDKSSNDSQSPAGRRKPKPKSNVKKANVDPTVGAKFIQVSKLVKRFKPVTVNGVATKSILEQVKQKEQNEPDYFKSQYKNSERLSYLQKYLLEFNQVQPQASLYVSFVLRPSDPEFPFDMEKLKLNMTVPPTFPVDRAARPSIVVLNEEIPRGFAANIEIGFRRIADLARGTLKDEEIELVSGSGLLSMVLTLDKYLEVFLKQEKRETIKFVKTLKKPVEQIKPASPKPEQIGDIKIEQQPEYNNILKEVIERRNQILEEMTSKIGEKNVRVFKRSKQETLIKVNIPIVKGSNFSKIPAYWIKNNFVEVMLSVPIDYPGSPVLFTIANNFSTNLIVKYGKDVEEQINLVKLTREYRQVEKDFGKNTKRFEFGDSSLIQKLNWLTNNLGTFCLEPEQFQTWNDNVDKLQKQIV
ncbi:hypothetical protein G9P44_006166 [Scheffersomyces stipitis]|nr:hypothetical protein G9P44_006166 [Scheffersomyces stipitis]